VVNAKTGPPALLRCSGGLAAASNRRSPPSSVIGAPALDERFVRRGCGAPPPDGHCSTREIRRASSTRRVQGHDGDRMRERSGLRGEVVRGIPQIRDSRLRGTPRGVLAVPAPAGQCVRLHVPQLVNLGPRRDGSPILSVEPPANTERLRRRSVERRERGSRLAERANDRRSAGGLRPVTRRRGSGRVRCRADDCGGRRSPRRGRFRRERGRRCTRRRRTPDGESTSCRVR